MNRHILLTIVATTLLLFCFGCATTASNRSVQHALQSVYQIQTPGEGSYTVGSGFRIHENLVITAAHVTGTLGSCKVDGYPADVVYTDYNTDVSIIFVPNILPGPPLGISSTNRLEKCYAVGYTYTPDDVVLLVSVGNVMHASREYTLHNAGIQSGMSGGPVLNGHGDVIGLTSYVLQWTNSTRTPNPTMGVCTGGAEIRRIIDAYFKE